MLIAKTLLCAVGGCALAATPLAAQAQTNDEGPRISAGITGGTLGIGPEVGVRLSNTIGLRANATFLGFGADFESDGVEYDGDLDLKSFGGMIDMHPFGGAFRVSAGARINRNRASVTAAPTGPVEVGDVTYTPAQIGVLTGRADVKDLAPALTFGWGGSKRRGFYFGTELGVLFQGSARVREFTATGTLANDTAFRAQLERERLEVQDDVDSVKVYPIAQLMLGFRF